MTCPKVPHVHRLQDCLGCCELQEFILFKPEEAMDCPACGFQVAFPDDFVVYTRFVLELMTKGTGAPLAAFPRYEGDASDPMFGR